MNIESDEVKVEQRTLVTPAGYVNQHIAARMVCGELEFVSGIEDTMSFPVRDNKSAGVSAPVALVAVLIMSVIWLAF